MDIVAIDFEFTNQSDKTICAVGLARPGKSVYYTLVQPPADTYWDPMCSFCHKITPEAVVDSPKLPEVWDSILDYIGDGLLVAHNAKSTERHVILKNTLANSLPCPRFQMLCSMVLAKRLFPDIGSYGLQDVADYLGDEFNHHNAGEDAFMSLRIAQLAIEKLGEDYCSNLVFYIDEISRKNKTKVPQQIRQELLKNRPEPDGRFEGVDFAFTGTLPVGRAELVQIVRSFAGTAADKGDLTNKTNFLVMGEKEYNDYANGNLSTNKVKKVKKMIESGKDVGILNYEEFMSMIYDN